MSLKVAEPVSVNTILAHIPGSFCKECRAWMRHYGARHFICTNEEAPCYLEATKSTFGCTMGVRQ